MNRWRIWFTSTTRQGCPFRGQHVRDQCRQRPRGSPGEKVLLPVGISQLLIDLTLTLPAILFLAFANLVQYNGHTPAAIDPVPALRAAARHSPTISPIACTAVVAHFFQAVAAGKLEQGITVSTLEYLLGSRTIFSAVTTPIKLRMLGLLTLPLIPLTALWALSPLGGQATLRIVAVSPYTLGSCVPVHYLEYQSRFMSAGTRSPAADVVVPAVIGVFSSALSSPQAIKSAG